MIKLKDRKICRKERIATSGIGMNQQVEKGNATSGKEKNATGVF